MTFYNVPAIGADWTTVFDLDFAAQPNQALNPDGVYVIGGFNWTKFNSANEAAATNIVAGSGLQIRPGAVTDYNGPTRSFPGLWMPMNQIAFPRALQFGDRLRIWHYVATDNIAANFDATIWGADTNDPTASIRYGMVAKRGFDVAGPGNTNFDELGNVNLGFNDNVIIGGLGATNQVCVLEGSFGDQARSLYHGTFGPSWPSIDACTLDNIVLAKSGAGMGTSTAASVYTIDSLGLVLGAQRSGSATALDVRIGRTRVDWKSK